MAWAHRGQLIKGLENRAQEASFKELDFFLETKKRTEADSIVIFKCMRGHYDGSDTPAALHHQTHQQDEFTLRQEERSFLLKEDLRLIGASICLRPS